MNKPRRYHLIAIGGSVMHNVALDLQDLGHHVTGSDDEIYEPSRSRLKARGLLPEKTGWDVNRITSEIDTIILGKHARKDNPELKRAIELGLEILSFPEFISRSSSASRRVCISGSHGKTSTTAMIMHVLKETGHDFDYLVGAQIAGFDKMVRVSGADLLVVEGDEYTSSPIDARAKMLHYDPTIAVITGVAWDHVNIYPTYKSYLDVFRQFLKGLSEEAICFFFQDDPDLLRMMVDMDLDCNKRSYLPFRTDEDGAVNYKGRKWPVRVFGDHNMANMKAAWLVCNSLGIGMDAFFAAIASFSGAAKRLQLIFNENGLRVYRDFAHAPSKAEATARAVRGRFKQNRIYGIIELHTFSSLNPEFIQQYKGTLDSLDELIIYYDPHAMEMKKMPFLNGVKVKAAFAHKDSEVVVDSQILEERIRVWKDSEGVLLIMSSGNMGGINLEDIFISRERD